MFKVNNHFSVHLGTLYPFQPGEILQASGVYEGEEKHPPIPESIINVLLREKKIRAEVPPPAPKPTPRAKVKSKPAPKPAPKPKPAEPVAPQPFAQDAIPKSET